MLDRAKRGRNCRIARTLALCTPFLTLCPGTVGAVTVRLEPRPAVIARPAAPDRDVRLVAMPSGSSLSTVSPSGVARPLGGGTLAGYRVEAIEIVSEEPQTGPVTVDVAIDATGPGSDLPALRPSPGRDRVFVGALRALVANPGDLPDPAPAEARLAPESHTGFTPEELPSVEGSGVDMVIVTSSPLAPVFQTLADWKTKKGVPTVVRTVEWIELNYPEGQDTPERIRSFLRDAYSKWGTYLALMGGDENVVPLRNAYSRYNLFVFGGVEIPTDLYYACLEGDWNGDGDETFGEGEYNLDPGDGADLYPDVLVGRAPVETAAEATTFVSKSMAYELAPPAGWVEDVAFLGEVLFPVAWKCPEDPPQEITIDGKELAETHAAVIDPSWTRTKYYQSDCNLDRSLALAALGAGHHVIEVVGHGDAFKFSAGNGTNPLVYIADIDALSNGDRLSFVVAAACNPNQLDLECLGESLMNNPDGGAIAVLGATRGDLPGPTTLVMERMYRLVFENGLTRFGEFTMLQRVPFATLAESDGLAWRWSVLVCNLFGDPELRLWTREPGALSAAHAPSAEVGTGSFPVTVTDGASPVADALVCASDGAGTYARARTDAAGVAVLDLSGSASPGLVDLVATAPELVAYQGTVTLSTASGPVVTAEDVVLDDDGTPPSNGNGDGVVDAGESIELVVTARNGGAVTASGVDVTASVEVGSSATFDLLWNGVRDPAMVHVGSGGTNPAAVPFTLDFSTPALDYTGAPFPTFAADSVEGGRGVYVWQDSEGWHLAWGSGVDPVAVSGTVTTDGRVRSLTALDLEAASDQVAISAGEDSLSFTAVTGPDDRFDSVSFTLSDSTAVSIASAYDPIGDIPPATSQTGTVVVDISTAARAGQIAYVDLEFGSSNGGPWTQEVTLVCAAPELEAITFAVDDSGVPPTVGDGDGIVEPGETVRLVPNVRNSGNGVAPAVTGSISAAAGGITIVDASESYGDIESHEETTGGDGFLFTVDTAMGTQVELVLSDAVGRVWAKDLVFGAPAPPQNPAFTSTDRTITVFWDPGPEPDLAGYNLFRSPDGLGGWVRKNTGLIRSGSRFVDPDVTIASTYYYRATAVDSAGNESGPSEELMAWAVQKQLGGWPQNANSNVYSSIGIVDSDRDGQAELYVGSLDWSLYAWESDGTLAAGFPVPTHNEIWSTPAHADLDGDLDLEILWGSRDGALYVVHHDGTPVFADSALFFQALGSGEVRSAPSVANVDADPEPEFFFGTDRGDVYGFHHDGTGLVDSTGILYSVTPTGTMSRVWGPIAVADLANDGSPEIVFASWNDSLYAVQPNGQIAPGFPRGAPTDYRTGPAVGDLDADGTLEIVCGNNGGGIHCYNHDGSDYLPGGVLAMLPDAIRSVPALANLDADPELEIVVSCFDGHLYAFEHDGTGFLAPDGLFAALDPTNAISASPIVVDVDGDGDFEIFVGHRNGKFYGFHHDGSLMLGFPIPTNLEIYSTATAGDLDGDGDIEVAFASYDETVNVLDFEGPSTSAAYEWPTFAGNHHRTSTYGPDPVSTDTGPAPAPLALALRPGAPNPFRDHTRIAFSVSATAPVRLTVYDVSGRLVRRLVSGRLRAGPHEVSWDGRDESGRPLASGVYFYRLESGGAEATCKVVRLR